MKRSASQSGFSMIEVLVTIAVVGFGFLSLLSLQMATLNTLSSNNQNYLAVSLANGMGERLRSNRDNSSFYNGADTSEFSKDCSQTNCSMIDYDLWQWKSAITSESQLPNGVGTVSIAGGMATVSISWTEKHPRKEASESSYTLEVPL